MANNHTSIFLFTVQGILASLTCGLCCFIYAYCYNNKYLKNENKNLEKNNKRNISKLNINESDCSNNKKRNVEKKYKNNTDKTNSLKEKIDKEEIAKNEQVTSKNNTSENKVIQQNNGLKDINNTLFEKELLKNNKNIEENSLFENIYNNVDSEKLIYGKKNLDNEQNFCNKIILNTTNHSNLPLEHSNSKEINDTSINQKLIDHFQIYPDKIEDTNNSCYVNNKTPYTIFNEERKTYINNVNNVNNNCLYNKLYSFESNKDINASDFTCEEKKKQSKSLILEKSNSYILASDKNAQISNVNNFNSSNNGKKDGSGIHIAGRQVSGSHISCSNRTQYNPESKIMKISESKLINKENEYNLYPNDCIGGKNCYNGALKDSLYIENEQIISNKHNETVVTTNFKEENSHSRNEFIVKKNQEEYIGQNYCNLPRDSKNYMNKLENCEKKIHETRFNKNENNDMICPNSLNCFNDISTLAKNDEQTILKNFEKKYLLDGNIISNVKINKIDENTDNFINYENKNNINTSEPSKYSIKSYSELSTDNDSKEHIELDSNYLLNNYSSKINNENRILQKAKILYNNSDKCNISVINTNNSINNCHNNHGINSWENITKVKDHNEHSSHTCSNFINFDKTNKLHHHHFLHSNNMENFIKPRKSSSRSHNFANEKNDISEESVFDRIQAAGHKTNKLFIDGKKHLSGNINSSKNGSNNNNNDHFCKKTDGERFKNAEFDINSENHLPDEKISLCKEESEYIRNNSSVKNNMIYRLDGNNECVSRKIIDDHINISEYKYDNYLSNYDAEKTKSNENLSYPNKYQMHKMNSVNDYISLYNYDCSSYKKLEHIPRNIHEHEEKEYIKNKENSDIYFLTENNINESIEKKKIFNELSLKNYRNGQVSSLNNMIIQNERELYSNKINSNVPITSLKYNERVNYEIDKMICNKKPLTQNPDKIMDLNDIRKEKHERDLFKKIEIEEHKENNEIKEIIYAYLQISKNEYNLNNYNKSEICLQKMKEHSTDEHILNEKSKDENKTINNFLKLNLNESHKYEEKINEKINVTDEQTNRKNYIHKNDDNLENNMLERKELGNGEYNEKESTVKEKLNSSSDIHVKNEHSKSNSFSVKKEKKKHMNTLPEYPRRSNRVKNEKNKKRESNSDTSIKGSVQKKKVKIEESMNSNKTIKKEDMLGKKKKMSKTQPMELKVHKKEPLLDERDKLELLCQKYNQVDENRCASGFTNFLMQHIQKKEDDDNFDDLLNFILKLKNNYQMKTIDFIEAFLIIEKFDLNIIRMYPIKEWTLVTFHYLKGNITDKNLKSLIKSLKLDNIIISNVTACFYMNKKQIKITEEDIKRILTILSDVVIRRSSRIKKFKDVKNPKDKQTKDEILGSCWHPANSSTSASKD